MVFLVNKINISIGSFQILLTLSNAFKTSKYCDRGIIFATNLGHNVFKMKKMKRG